MVSFIARFQRMLRLVFVLLLLSWTGKCQFSIYPPALLIATGGNKVYI